jgi:sodium/potassium/calcium exchanger 6
MHYLLQYYCSDVALRPVVFARLVLWLIFLFSTLGISASDFFTPNLATIAQLLGLDENVAGVTFLAFGNGSPDVFSTFSAMRANSGSLALGELIGAATFIVSCVVGSVCIIKPFQVHRKPFLRDVGFFTIAVGLVIAAIWDGRISAMEAGAMVGLYVIYGIVVVGGSWWDRRQERRRQIENLIRNEYAEEATFLRYTDERTSFLGFFASQISIYPSAFVPQLSVSPSSPRQRATSAPNALRIQTDTSPRRYPRAPSPSPSLNKLPSFSLVGALEFRDVVASLKRESAASSLGIFDSPVAPYAGGHYHRPASLSPRSQRHTSLTHLDESSTNGLRLGSRHTLSTDSDATMHDHPAPGPSDYFLPYSESRHELPYIMRTPASPSASTSDAGSEEQLYVPPSKRQHVWFVLRQTFHTLFPTLSNFRQQSILSKIACILAAPAVLCLTLTLPVVVTPYGNDPASPEKMLTGGDARLVDFEEEGQERVLIAEEEMEENMHQLQFNRWLMAVQCICGPLFCIAVLLGIAAFTSFRPSQLNSS